MNRVYRLVFNRASGVLQAVSETAHASGGGSSGGEPGTARGGRRRLVARRGRFTAMGKAVLALAVAMPVGAVLAQTLPTGGAIFSGFGEIHNSSGGVQSLTQGSSYFGVTWVSFDVGAGGLVAFDQPLASSTVLNRISSGVRSQIDGRITSRGKVFITNPGGIAVGSSASLATGSLLLTSLGVTSAGGTDNYVLESGSLLGGVYNNGSIEAASGGAVALVGGVVRNTNRIVASGGRIEMTAARSVELGTDGSGRMVTAIPASGALQNALDTTLPAVDNTGTLQADDGTIVLQAEAAPGLFTQLVRNSGTVQARSTDAATSGSVTLSARGGDVVTGATSVIDVSGVRGGQVTLYSDTGVSVAGSINATGTTSGGTISMAGGSIDFANGHEVDAGSGTITLSSSGAITQAANGSLSAETLAVDSAGATSLGGANKIVSLGRSTANGFSLNNAGYLMVVGALDGGASVALKVDGHLLLGSDVSGRTVALESMGHIIQTSGTLTADKLWGSSRSDAMLGNVNQIGELGYFDSIGSLSLKTARALTVSGDVWVSNFTLDAANGTVVTGSIETFGPRGMRVNAGTLQIGNGGSTGSIDGDIHLDTALTFKRNNALSYAGQISGGTSLIQAGTGKLTLTGASTYTGGTTINAGTLEIGDGGNSGSITGNVVNNAALVFNRSGLSAFAGNISGTGSLTKTGTGMLVYTGDATHGGGTTINRGTLQVGDGGITGSVAGNIDNNGALVFNRSDAVAFAGDINGTGSMTKSGAGTLVYTGNATHTGGTTIDSGTLEIRESGSIFGNITNNAALVFNRSADTTFAGDISGTGSLTWKGARKLTLTGNNTFTGTTTVVAGRTLQIGDGGGSGSIAGNITNDGDLVFDRTGDLSYAGSIDGSGTLAKNGAGILELTGASTYVGATDVNAGTLRVNNAAGSATGAGPVLVKSGATLSGGGTIAGQVTIADGATLAPGSNLGTLNIGSLLLGSGSRLNYELGQAGVAGGALNDLVRVDNGLVLDGTLNVAEAPGGSFGPGLYRLISYTGSLVDNGLNIGTAPTGTPTADLYVQSSVKGEINLINSKGVELRFWDGSGGDATQYNDGRIGGGSGTWRIGNSGLNDPSDGWTDVEGKGNTGWKQDQFALFAGAAGTVTVDNSGGAIRIEGAQFSTSGYVVTGDALALGKADTVVKVGDGTASGAQMSATIESVLTGAGGLTKDDMGTLILKGANTYTGGTLVRAGTLQGDTTSLRGPTVNNAQVAFDQVASGSFAGTMSGSGSLRKSGSGELLLTAANTYKGGTHVDGGTLNVGLTGAIGTGPVDVSGGAGLIFSGNAQAESLKIVAGQAGSGFVQFTDDTSAGSANLVVGTTGAIDFRGNATAGSATIENHNDTTFWFNASAGKAHITNFAGGTTHLWDDASAGQATIVNEKGGVLDMRDNATAAQASVVNKAGGTVSLSKLGTPGTTIGSLEGAGRVLLGAKALTTGALNTDTEVSGVISGVGGSLVKVGTGALTLSGANTHTGGATLRQGRLNVGHSQALGTGTLSMDDDTTLGFSAGGLTIANTIKLTGNNDPVIDTGAFSGALSGAISGGGFITKQGTGTLTLSGANTYTGATNVAQGSLKAGAANTLSAASAHNVAAGATLDLAGFNQTVASLTNSGTVSLAGATAGNTLTVKGAYVGNNGVLKLSTTLNGTGPSDRLVLDGASAIASGKTTVQIANLGGLGALTSGNGIEVITAQNGATTTAQTSKGAFSLAGGHVDAGAYEYRLHAADASGTGENWYLRSTTDTVAPGQPVGLPVVTYRPEAALYAALPSQLRQGNLAMLGDVRKRVGDDDVKGTATEPNGSDRRAWARVLSTDIDVQQRGTVSPTSKGRLTGFQAGTDLLATPNWRAGLYVGQLDGDARVSGFASGIRNLAVGRNDLRSQYVGVYGTYTADSGFYADAVVQSGRHRYTVEPMLGAGVGGKGHSLLGSIEVGQAFAIGGSGWRVEPQLQLIHHHMDLGNSAIVGAITQPEADSGWIARAGVRVKGQIDTGMGVLQPYGRFNVYKTLSGTDVARFVNGATSTDIAAPTGGTSTELAGGFTLALNQTTSLYGEVGKLWSSGGDAKVKSSINGSLGVRVKW